MCCTYCAMALMGILNSLLRVCTDQDQVHHSSPDDSLFFLDDGEPAIAGWSGNYSGPERVCRESKSLIRTGDALVP